jgi:hypothetical protein
MLRTLPNHHVDTVPASACGVVAVPNYPTRIPIEKQENVQWLENLKQATELPDHLGRQRAPG